MSNNPILFNAHALPTHNNEPHAQLGNHLRVNSHPGIGLPIAPFLVERAEIYGIKNLNVRHNVVFKDSKDAIISAPFTLTKDNPITAYIPLSPGETCIWAQVDAIANQPLSPDLLPVDHQAPQGNDNPFDLIHVPPVPGTSGRRGSITRRRLLDVPYWRTDRLRLDLGRLSLPFCLKSQLVCEAFLHSAMGPASIGRRSKPRYAFSGPGIVQIEIRGTGLVKGFRWIEMNDVQHLKFRPHDVLALPHEGGTRYVSIVNARARAHQRVNLQSPKRAPLQETVNTPSPQTAQLWNAADEEARVKSLTTTLDEDLDTLINDTSLAPHEHIVEDTIIDDQTNTELNANVAQSSISRLGRVLQTQADHGTASYLGYKTVDTQFDDSGELLVFYRIWGFFRDYPTKEPSINDWILDAKIAQLADKQRNLDKKGLLGLLTDKIKQFQGVKLNQVSLQELEEVGSYFYMETTAIADRGAPLDKVRPPVITKTEHSGWLPEVPPTANREVIVDVANVRIAGLLAGGKQTPASGAGNYETLNKKNPAGFHLPLALSLNVDDETGEPITVPGSGFVADRLAEASSIRYLIAQQDRFGRWSNWRAKNAAAGPHPKPPRPEFQAFYTQPLIADAAVTGGQVYVKISVPDREALAPGSHLLDRLRLIVRDETLEKVIMSTTTYHVAEATKFAYPDDPATFFVTIEFTGMVLQPTEKRRLHMTAFWIDTANVLSDESAPQRLLISDPRPPGQIPVPDQLQYSARPDITGLSWVEYRWSAAANQNNFGIYYTDENRLQAHFNAEGENTLLDNIANAADAAARATLYRNNLHLIPDHLFERLRDVNVEFSSGEKGFRHGVSGSLRLLNFYKIAAEAATGAKPVLVDLPLIVYAVPNADPPARPVLFVTPDEPLSAEPDYVARVKISLTAGTTKGENWRLRRSSVESHNPWKMPVVSTGKLSPVDPTEGTGEQTSEYRDTGPVQISSSAQLKPWVRYSWVAEVQGAPESGSAAAGQVVQGRWSQASDPVSLVLIPEATPVAVSIDSVNKTVVAGGFGDVTLSVNHAQSLDGGVVGNYLIRVMRRTTAESAMETLHEQIVAGNGPFTINGVKESDPAEVVPVNSEYILQLIDPLGRTSDTTSVIVN